MSRIKPEHKDSPPALPTAWVDAENGHRIYWDPSREPWLGFMQKINDYCDGNNKGRPPESAVEEQICTQMPVWFCDGAPAAEGSPRMIPSSGGCSACGKR